MSSAAETVQAIQKALGPYIRPREEAEHIRRILALNLRSCHEGGPQNSPLALAESDCTIKTTDARGLQRDYLKALHANIKAQREYESVIQHQGGIETKGANASERTDAGRLEEQVTFVKLRQKQERLQISEKYLDLLSQKPAASSDFMQPGEVFRGSAHLPAVPSTVVSSFTGDSSSTKTDLKALVDRLEKAVLRSKLLLKKEELLLEQVKARSTVSSGKVSDGVKLAALHATRNELITWMEAELAKASAVDEPAPENSQWGGAQLDKAHMNEQLALIKDKYANYVAARKSLIQLVAQSPHPSIRPSEETHSTARSEPPPPAPSTHLITPYIENMLSISHEQKASITQKSHFSSVLAKQTEETGKALALLGEESQLLPEHPVRSRQGHLGGHMSHKKGQEIVNRVQPWISAADAAKLATLEAVAETLVQGQTALEASTKHLAEIDQLLGRSTGMREKSIDGDSTIDDIWLAETQSPQKGSQASMKKKADAFNEPKDAWSLLDGNLGLINAEDFPRR
ncbi:unnamed protein product [Discula destructiva]